MRGFLPVVLLFLSGARAGFGAPSPTRAKAHAPAPAKVVKPQAGASPLNAYGACRFDDGLQTLEVLPLPPTVVGRTVETMHGSAKIGLLRGERVYFGYTGTDPFAKVVVEQLPAGSYDTEKADLISNFEQMLASDDGTRNYALKPTLNGFAIVGLDRSKFEGGAVGVYLLIDDRSGVVSTVYFLDADAARRKFATMAEYTAMRDHFLQTYTACVHRSAATAPGAAGAPGAAAKRSR